MKLTSRIFLLTTFFLTCVSISMAQTGTLVLISDGDGDPVTKTINWNQPIGTLPTPNKSGYTFKHWEINSATPASLVGTIISATTIWTYGEGPVVATAKYDIAVRGSVTFDSDGGTAVPPIENLELNQLISKPADPTKSGSIFRGWYKEISLITEWNFDANKVTGSITLYAKWVSATAMVTVTFDSNNGSSVAPETMKVGELLTEPTPPTKSGSFFAGWYKESTFNTLWNFNSSKVFETITLYAKWVPENTQFSVTFWNGAINLKHYQINVNSLITDIPAAPIKNGFTFGGWIEIDQSIVWDFGKNRVTDHVAFQPKWISPTSQFTVTFETNGGSTVKNMTIKANTAFNRPSNPTKIGYTFGGWYKEERLASLWNFTKDKVIANITLYAKWIPINYKVTFNSNKGTAIPFANVAHNNTLTSPKDPTKKGYTFGGWYKEIKLLTAWDFSNDVVTKAITLYAKWDAPTGIIKEDYLLKLYPNPATTEIKIENIEQTEAATIEIFDLTGKLVLQVLVGEYIDVSALPQGIYSVKAGNYTAKFMKR